ncbi:uncharacterized protein EDB93DRAFT_1207920, partial [Suillus bovinus]|uniref:uncharacterized protein n=1 Tax=Suillus bovinus TaxID=48563 RepID=UPI001B87A2CE
MYGPLPGGVPPNVPYPQQFQFFNQLPFHGMDDIGYQYETPFHTMMPGPVPQEDVRNNLVGLPPSVPQTHMGPTLPPAPTTETTNPMTTSLRNSPAYRMSEVSGPSMLSPLNTSGVTVHSHSQATPLNRASQSPGFYGPDSMTATSSRRSPISPSQKRPLESSVDDTLVCNILNLVRISLIASSSMDGGLHHASPAPLMSTMCRRLEGLVSVPRRSHQ